jgi:hypothetical protein
MKPFLTFRKARSYLYLFLCNLMFVAATNAQAGWLDSAKRLVIDATEPIGLCVIVIGGMRISTKDLYGGIAAVVGGIFIFKAQDIISGLK